MVRKSQPWTPTPTPTMSLIIQRISSMISAPSAGWGCASKPRLSAEVVWFNTFRQSNMGIYQLKNDEKWIFTNIYSYKMRNVGHPIIKYTTCTCYHWTYDIVFFVWHHELGFITENNGDLDDLVHKDANLTIDRLGILCWCFYPQSVGFMWLSFPLLGSNVNMFQSTDHSSSGHRPQVSIYNII